MSGGPATHGSVPAKAAHALECDGRPYSSGAASYDDGLTNVGSNYGDAAAEFIGPNNDGGLLPKSGYRIAASHGGRVLLSFEVSGRTKAAILLRDGIMDYEQHQGWGVETWAACDPAEYPATVAEHLGFEFWQNGQGNRVPIGEVQSFSAAFCDYSGTNFLQVGKDPHTTVYVRDPDAQLTRYLRMPYDGSAALPADARDSGYHRNGRELWFGSHGDAVYLVAAKSDVQRWPAVSSGVGCG